ncbi:hypothetical protein MPRF_05420 [Mycolicibacterium parafortuitum]|uniref:PE-PPE domain-containing protein n=2 Tax=Mycolicibacterium parafortuitum TaxID=39692 RepID=A0A7I7TYD5_MYCPF|nr:hypothetical protein MPRF_05420 [Mycolicibacterium parafortuitum]
MIAMALAGAAVIGAAPTIPAGPQLMASLHYLRGTNIGGVPTEQQFEDFIGAVVDGSGVTPPDSAYRLVPYSATFRPFSHGGFRDLTYDDSVAEGVELLAGHQLSAGDVVFGFSQGAVAASVYKETHTGNVYLLVGNPGRPNGGVMQRFDGAKIPLLDVTFGGATPNNGDLTIDVTRQYDGWSDFPRYVWNPVAVLNAIMGTILVHSPTQTELTAADLAAARDSGDPAYYQYDAGSNTHYYVIKTYPIPLLMPLDPFLSDAAMAALDAPLRTFIESSYDRTDYSQPARAGLVKPVSAEKTNAAPQPAAAADIAEEPETTESDVEVDARKPRDRDRAARDAETTADEAAEETVDEAADEAVDEESEDDTGREDDTETGQTDSDTGTEATDTESKTIAKESRTPRR